MSNHSPRITHARHHARVSGAREGATTTCRREDLTRQDGECATVVSIERGQSQNGFYGKSVRSTLNPNLNGLHTHTDCNSAYKADEEYYAASFASHADSNTARSVVADWRRGLAKGHDQGLLRTILNQFGNVVMADGSKPFNYDVDRAGRVTWKLVRGVYFAEIGRFLPERLPKRLIMLSPHENQHAAEKYPWWQLVRDTAPMGTHGAVFD